MTTQYKIIEKKNLWFTLSLLFICAGLSMMLKRGINSTDILNYGIDFKGGSNLMLKFNSLENSYQSNPQTPKKEINTLFIKKLRNHLKQNTLEKSDIQVTNYNEVIIKTNLLTNKKSENLLERLEEEYGNIEVLEIDFIGPSIGTELKQKSIWIIVIVSLALLFYISWRFEFIFGIAALIGVLHDALITVSYASFTNMEINTAFVAAILTVLGYSINDTIVIFDRIRENIKLYPEENIKEITNLSLNQTLPRTINTSLTTLLVIVALLIFGGTTIKAFTTVLLIGIVSGTYSSLFVASPILARYYRKKESQ